MEDAGSGQDGGRGEADKDRLIEELREAVRARDEFVAIAAHELRNPMTPILMQVHNLAAAARNPRRCRPEILAPRLELLEHAVRDFVRRSTTLLDVSRVAAGNVRIELAEVDLSSVVRAWWTARASRRGWRGAPWRRTCRRASSGLWDRLALEQVAENLLSNALKFGAGKPVDVALRADGRAARLAIRDRGIGISEEDRARVFKRFERAVTRREHGGFGVGLWLANQLVAAMGGAVAVESAPGEGTTFTVVLPLGGGAERAETSGA
jgi:signal transduction histidine kinase